MSSLITNFQAPNGYFRSIPYNERVRERGEEPAVRRNSAPAIKPGILDTIGAEYKQNSLLMSIWRWGALKRARIFGETGPNGWSPKEHISGFFKNYEDYLLESENPEELELRKNYVIQRMNYERMMSQIGGNKTNIIQFSWGMLGSIYLADWWRYWRNYRSY